MEKQSWQPIDKLAIFLIMILLVVIGALVWGVERTTPRITSFSWYDNRIQADDKAFLFTFSRPMEQESVEQNLQIEPPLPGKFSWAGRRMAYTLDAPAPYGVEYQVSLEGARESFKQKEQLGKAIEPFKATFRTSDRAFAYIGVGQEEGQLIVWNLTQEKKKVLTPPNLVVSSFEIYPEGDKILFLANDRKSLLEGAPNDKLYTVTTGINDTSESESDTVVELLLGNQSYYNLKFDLSQDGKTVVVQRLHRENSSDFGLWIIKPDAELERLDQAPGGDFLIAPDSQTMAITQGQGIAIVPIEPEAEAEPLNFLPKYGRILSFSRDGSAAAMVDFNTNDPELRYTQSLFFVNNQGIQKKLLTVPGSIHSCQFDPTLTNLYCVVAQRIEGTEEYQEQPYLVAVDIKKEEAYPLALLPNQLDIHMSLSPDGLGLMIDQIVTPEDPNFLIPPGLMTTSSGEIIIGGQLWLLVTSPTTPADKISSELEKLPINGINPRWFP